MVFDRENNIYKSKLLQQTVEQRRINKPTSDNTLDRFLPPVKLSLDIEWPPEYVQNYFEEIALESTSVKPLSEFPKMIDLGFHPVLDAMRATTGQIDREIHLDILHSESEGIVIPEIVAIGEKYKVSGDTKIEYRKKVNPENKYKIVGSLHTHPHLHSKNLQRLSRKWFFRGSFSAADMYIAINPKSTEQFIGVATDEENVFAFRSEETNHKDSMAYIPEGKETRQERFSKFWYARHGITYHCEKSGNWVSKDGGGKISDNEFWNVVLDIASWHDLALYRGKPDSNIHRFHPKQEWFKK